MTPSHSGSGTGSIDGRDSFSGSHTLDRPASGGYFSATPVQSTPSTGGGYFSASSTATPTPTSAVQQCGPHQAEEEDGTEEDEETETATDDSIDDDDENQSVVDEAAATVAAAVKVLSTPTLTSTTPRPGTPSAMGLDFGNLDLDIDMSSSTRGHQSPPVRC